MLRTCTYLLVLFTFYSFYVGDNLSEAAPTEPPKEQVTTTNNDGFSDPEKAGIIVGVIIPIITSSIVAIIAVIGWYLLRKVLVATIEEKNDGSLSCEVKIGEKRVVNHVTYKWYKLNLQDTQQPQRDLISTSNNLPQQKSVFDSQQTYQCEVKYTAIRKNFCCRIRKTTSNTLTVGKKYLVARIENSDDDSLICEVTLDNESVIDHLTYKWYENDKIIDNETDKQLQQRQSVFVSKQKYKCDVVYKRGNITVEATSNTLTVKKKSIIATIEECSDGKLKCNVEKDNECIDDDLTYQWYDGVKELPGETGKFLAQNPVSFESVQKYRCEVKYTASNWNPDVIVKPETCNTLIKRLIAKIEANEDGSVKCEAKQNGESIHRDDLTYTWYESDDIIPSETGQVLPQQRAIFEHNKKYSCAVVYTKGNRQIKATSHSLELRKKYLLAKIERSDNDSLICEVTLDNEPINVAYLTYKWYENETKIPQETHKQLQQQKSMFMSKQNYKCVVVYKRGNISIEASDTLTVEKKRTCYNTLAERYKHISEKAGDWPPISAAEFVKLKLVRPEKNIATIKEYMDQVYGDKQDCEYDTHFNSPEVGSRYLLVGRPGSGKTTLLEKIACDNACSSETSSNRKLVLFVKLRGLNKIENVTVNDLLNTACPSLSKDTALLSQLYNPASGENIVFIFDGFDEYSPGVQTNNLVVQIIHKDMYPRSAVIVSSRPIAIHSIKEGTTMIEVVGFEKKEVMNYIRTAFKGNDGKHDRIKKHLEDHKKILQICYLPLHCAILVFLFKQDESCLPQTETEFYKEFTISTLLHYFHRDNSKKNDHPKRLKDFEQLPPEERECFKKICALAFWATVNKLQSFTNTDVSKFEIHGVSTGTVENSLGLLVTTKFDQMGGPLGTGMYESFSFVHLTLQEYLTAIHIARFSGNASEERIEKVVHEHTDVPTIMRFLFGSIDYSNKESAKKISEQALEATDDHYKDLHPLWAYEGRDPIASTEMLICHKNSLRLHFTDSDNPTYVTHILSKADYESTRSITIELNLPDRGRSFEVAVAEDLLNSVGYRELLLTVHCSDKNHLQSFLDALRSVTSLKLTELKLNNNSIDNDGAKHLSDAIKKFSTLKKLSLAENDIGVKGAEHISDAIKILSTLTHLDLALNGIGDKGAEHISDAIKKLSTLTHLDLHWNNIGDKGAKHISDAIKESSSLEVLDLGFNSIGDEGAEHISDAIKESSSLKELHLYRINIGDEGAKHLSDAMESPSLALLDLRWNNIDERGQELLMTAEKSINLNRKPINPQGQSELRIDCGFQQLDD